MDLDSLVNFNPPQRKAITVVRVKRNYYRDNNGAFISQVKLSILKRKSFGHCMIEEDCDNTDCEVVMSRIVNLDEVSDGVYELAVVNVSHDFETGYIDNWDYKLIKE